MLKKNERCLPNLWPEKVNQQIYKLNGFNCANFENLFSSSVKVETYMFNGLESSSAPRKHLSWKFRKY